MTDIRMIPARDMEKLFKIFSDVSPDIADFKESAIPAIISRIMNNHSWIIMSGDTPICVCWLRKTDNETGRLGFIYSNEFMKNQGKGITYYLSKKLEEYASLVKKFEIHSLLSHVKSESWYKYLGFKNTGKSYTDSDGHTVTIFERIV